MTEPMNANLRAQLHREDGQEDLTFLFWRPSTGSRRLTAIIDQIVPPVDGDRIINGNVAFTAQYAERAISAARRAGLGLAIVHTHPLCYGWQNTSPDDVAAELRLARGAFAATGMPLIGLTMAGDGCYSARFWTRIGAQKYARSEAESVRVVGYALRAFRPEEIRCTNAALNRTESVWGSAGQEALERLRIGTAGVGSVGSAVQEGLARMGVRQTVLVDRDLVEISNLDRLLNATFADVGRTKISVARDAMIAHSTAPNLDVRVLENWCHEEDGYRALLDCDVIFSCVDRPWARRVLNELAYANLIPIIDGGILVRKRASRMIGADMHIRTSGPGRRCLQCWGAFDPGEAAIDRDGLLDKQSYVQQLDPNHPLISKDNVYGFSAQVGAMEVLQLTALINGPMHNIGDQNFHYATGVCETTKDCGCEPACPYNQSIGLGDRSAPPLKAAQTVNS